MMRTANVSERRNGVGGGGRHVPGLDIFLREGRYQRMPTLGHSTGPSDPGVGGATADRCRGELGGAQRTKKVWKRGHERLANMNITCCGTLSHRILGLGFRDIPYCRPGHSRPLTLEASYKAHSGSRVEPREIVRNRVSSQRRELTFPDRDTPRNEALQAGETRPIFTDQDASRRLYRCASLTRRRG